MSPLKSLKSFLSVPLLWRELSQLAARKRTYVFRILYGTIVFSVAWVAFREIIELGDNPGFEVMGRGADLFKAVVVCQYSVVYVFLPAYCAGLISGEKERDTLQLMFTTKLSPWSIIIEKMLSRLIPFALLIVISVPILAVAPMIIVVLYNIGISGLIAKASTSAYLFFFPVVVGMVKGLRSPDAMQLDLMRTYNASAWQVFWKLRWPSSLPYLFTSLKIAIAIALVGAIIGELPTGAQGGFGARMLNGSYYGQVLIIWSALIGAAVCAGLMVGLIGLVQRITLSRMGLAR